MRAFEYLISGYCLVMKEKINGRKRVCAHACFSFAYTGKVFAACPIHKNQEEGYKMYQIKKKTRGGRGHGF